MSSNTPSAPSSLQLELAHRIALAIRDGIYAPGEHLTEQGLASTFAVSRTPVRMALRVLEEQHFVESRANNGVFVAAKAHKLSVESLAPRDTSEEDLYRNVLARRHKGELGASFSESELLAAYGTSKAVLSRVLLRLAREGFIERRRGHGWSFTAMLDTQEARDQSYRFRMLVECGGLREPTFAVDAAELARMRETHERFVKLRSRSAAGFFEMNARFHEMIARFSGNRFIEAAVRQQNQLRRLEEYENFLNRAENIAESCAEHIQIMDAIAGDEREWAAALLHRHLSGAARI